jgi:predicted RNA binding protein YcfA (HicA-like mRNA interferase family)
MTSTLELLLERVRGSPRNVPFRVLLRLLDLMGYELDRQRGSHMIFKRHGAGPRINLQRQGSVAKEYQVRQVLRAAETILEDSGE